MLAGVEVLGKALPRKRDLLKKKGGESSVGVWGTAPLQREQQEQSPTGACPARLGTAKKPRGRSAARSVRPCGALGLTRHELGSRDFEQRGGVISPPS